MLYVVRADRAVDAVEEDPCASPVPPANAFGRVSP